MFVINIIKVLLVLIFFLNYVLVDYLIPFRFFSCNSSCSGECCFCGELMIRDIDTPFIDDLVFQQTINDWL